MFMLAEIIKGRTFPVPIFRTENGKHRLFALACDHGGKISNTAARETCEWIRKSQEFSVKNSKVPVKINWIFLLRLKTSWLTFHVYFRIVLLCFFFWKTWNFRNYERTLRPHAESYSKSQRCKGFLPLIYDRGKCYSCKTKTTCPNVLTVCFSFHQNFIWLSRKQRNFLLFIIINKAIQKSVYQK